MKTGKDTLVLVLCQSLHINQSRASFSSCVSVLAICYFEPHTLETFKKPGFKSAQPFAFLGGRGRSRLFLVNSPAVHFTPLQIQLWARPSQNWCSLHYNPNVLVLAYRSNPRVCTGIKPKKSYICSAFESIYLSASIIHRFLTSNLSLSATSPIFLSPFFTPCGIPETALSNALNYTHHWSTEQRAIVFSSFLLLDLAACCLPSRSSGLIRTDKQMRGNSTLQSTEVWVWLIGCVLCEGRVERLIATKRPPGSQILHAATEKGRSVMDSLYVKWPQAPRSIFTKQRDVIPE